MSAGSWDRGNRDQARASALALSLLVYAAMEGAADGICWGLLHLAYREAEGVHKDVDDPLLDGGHVAEGAGRVLLLLTGARFVPDARAEDAERIRNALALVTDVFHASGYAPDKDLAKAWGMHGVRQEEAR
jgi:hypothetical protein